MKSFVRVITTVVILGGFGYTLWHLYEKSQEAPIVFETTQAFTSNIIRKTVATGSIVPKKEVAIKPRVSGIIEKVYVEEGEMVKKGDAIAVIKIVPDMVSLNNAKNRLQMAKLSLNDAQEYYNRQKDLLNQGVIAEAEFQPLRTALNNAKQEVLAAENNLQLIEEGALKDEGAASNTIIRSTATGMVLDVPLKAGNSVVASNAFNDGTTVASIADMGEMIFEGKVDESEVGKIKEGMNLLITIGALEGHTFTARLDHISPKGVEENGAIQFKLKAHVQLQQDLFIRSGYSANADIVLERRDSVLVIPEALLIFGKTSDSVFVEVETGTQIFEKRAVELGLSDGINVEVLSGIDTSNQIKQPM
ncbi:MAG: efflux RND transporter periplasmic adaptor subunit [Flavobacteriales bacterium]|nr:efflux RND transporter periplasmic adaptor subunit [Flavobacteriales bacterium]